MKNEELYLQKAVVEFIRYAAPSLVFYAVPNGGFRTKAEAGMLKAMGQRAGVGDLAFVLPGGRCAFIELKCPGKYQSPEQKVFEADVLLAGGLYLVCRSVHEVAGALAAWGVPLKAKVAA